MYPSPPCSSEPAITSQADPAAMWSECLRFSPKALSTASMPFLVSLVKASGYTSFGMTTILKIE